MLKRKTEGRRYRAWRLLHAAYYPALSRFRAADDKQARWQRRNERRQHLRASWLALCLPR